VKRSGFGLVTRRERQQAESFWRDLAGPPLPSGPTWWPPVAGSTESLAEDAAEDRTRVDLRNAVVQNARDKKTFLTEAAVTQAIDGRASRAELARLFDARVAACAPSRRRADLRGADMTQQLTFYWGLIDAGASQLLALLESDPFRCGTTSALEVHRDIIDGLRAAWTRSGEALTVGALCRGPAPAICPSTHAQLHQPSGGTGSDAAHFTDLTQDQIRTVEIAGLFGVDLRNVAQGDRASTAVKTRPTAVPLQPVTFAAIRKGTRRAIHVSRETPRRVESWVEDQPWVCLPFIPAASYRLFKRRFWEASLHRQWGVFYSVAWIAGLTNFYRDNAGLLMGVGDISHVVGEVMTDHKSHRVGKDVDCYVLEDPPAGSQFPVAFWCSGTSANPEFRELGAPAADAQTPTYTIPGGGVAGIAAPRRTTLLDRYATILAYCVATKAMVEAAVWHAGPGLAPRALALAQAAWDRTAAANQGTRERPGWRATWGFGPTSRAAITAAPSSMFVGDGSSNYGAGRDWPPHQDHIHVRLR